MNKALPVALFDSSVDRADQSCRDAGLASYRWRQAIDWLSDKRVIDPAMWTNLAVSDRLVAAQLMGVDCVRSGSEVSSADGQTRKFLFELSDGERVESVLMPSTGTDTTVCLSSQVGCAMGCRFCRTATMGLRRNLSPAEIVWQWLRVASLAQKRPDRIVMMGMGEPLHNLDALLLALQWFTHADAMAMSPRRITVSTVGLLDRLEILLRETRVNVAVSLNAPDHERRLQIMPVERKHSFEEVVTVLRTAADGQRKVTAEYVMLKGFNDGESDADKLSRAFAGSFVRVNLIPFNPFPRAAYERPDRLDVEMFMQRLRKRGVTVYTRWSRGDDVLAACGQLATQQLEKAA